MIFGKPRYLGLLRAEDEICEGVSKRAFVVINTSRGAEVAVVAGELSEEQVERYSKCYTAADGNGARDNIVPLQEVSLIRTATEDEIKAMQLHREEEDAILIRARELLRLHKLPMKLVDAEFILDRKKLFFYFTAEQRVDFRSFVRDLAREFHTRIELRQIGTRDEAKVVAGLSPCGMPCCCGYWMHRFYPVCIKMVKEQNLALNPAKISGLCGRLMCCIGYEHANYADLWKDLPSPGSKIKTDSGAFVVVGVDVNQRAARVLTPDSIELRVPVGEFEEFKERVMRGERWDGGKPTFPVSAGLSDITEAADAIACNSTVSRDAPLQPSDNKRPEDEKNKAKRNRRKKRNTSAPGKGRPNEKNTKSPKPDAAKERARDRQSG